MMRHLCLSLLPHFFLVQTGTFVPLPFNQGLKVLKPCQVFPGHSTILTSGLAWNYTMESTTPFWLSVLSLCVWEGDSGAAQL